MQHPTDPTFVDLLAPGPLGDTELTLKLTARQLASFQLIVALGSKTGVLEVAYIAAIEEGVADDFEYALREAEARIGLALTASIAPGHENRALFSAQLAEVQQAKAASAEGDA